jgi:drug/metabolite transporter (DMT)-like permease
VIFGVLGVVREGPAAVTRLDAGDVLAGAYLAVGVTATAFVLWYTSVERLGAGRAGLLTGIAPIAAAVTGVVLGGPLPGPAVWLGVATVAFGLGVGLSSGDRGRGRTRTSRYPASAPRRPDPAALP